MPAPDKDSVPGPPRNPIWIILALTAVLPVLSVGALIVFGMWAKGSLSGLSGIVTALSATYGFGAVPAALGTAMLYALHRIRRDWFKTPDAFPGIGFVIGLVAVGLTAAMLGLVGGLSIAVPAMLVLLIGGLWSGALGGVLYREMLMGRWRWVGWTHLVVAIALALTLGWWSTLWHRCLNRSVLGDQAIQIQSYSTRWPDGVCLQRSYLNNWTVTLSTEHLGDRIVGKYGDGPLASFRLQSGNDPARLGIEFNHASTNPRVHRTPHRSLKDTLVETVEPQNAPSFDVYQKAFQPRNSRGGPDLIVQGAEHGLDLTISTDTIVDLRTQYRVLVSVEGWFWFYFDVKGHGPLVDDLPRIVDLAKSIDRVLRDSVQP